MWALPTEQALPLASLDLSGAETVAEIGIDEIGSVAWAIAPVVRC